ncbi:MAG TPA: hypothetical protein VGD52_21355, partial [Pseudoduganella sp.]
ELPPLQPSRAPLSGLPPLPELPLDAPLAQPLALDLEAESDAALVQQHTQRWLPGPRPRSYAQPRPALRPVPQAPAPAEAAEMICQALERLPASSHDVEIVRLYDQPGWGNFDFRIALEGALIRAVESRFDQRLHMVRAIAQTLNWEQVGQYSPNAEAIVRLLARTRAREWISQFDTWPTDDPTLQAVWLLAGPVDRLRFNDFAKARKRLDAMQSLLHHLADKSGYVVGNEINAASFEWWSANIVRLRGGRAPAPRTAQGKAKPAAAEGKPWKREVNFGVAIGIMLLMLIMISNAAQWIKNS